MSWKSDTIKNTDTPGFDPKRRSFLGAMAAAAGVTLAPGVILYAVTKAPPASARALDAAVSAKVRWGMLIDLNRCDSGCSASGKSRSRTHRPVTANHYR